MKQNRMKLFFLLYCKKTVTVPENILAVHKHGFITVLKSKIIDKLGYGYDPSVIFFFNPFQRDVYPLWRNGTGNR
jgi:hypothetical protein